MFYGSLDETNMTLVRHVMGKYIEQYMDFFRLEARSFITMNNCTYYIIENTFSVLRQKKEVWRFYYIKDYVQLVKKTF